MRDKLSILMLLAAATAAFAAQYRVVGDWPGDLDGPWQRRDFEGRTEYTAGAGEVAHVRAVADGGASALYREIEIDLEATPYLQWSWRVEQLPAIEAGETKKDGDDYGARVYVVREGLFGKLTAEALNYAWSQRQPVGSLWPNAFTGRTMMWSVEQGDERVGEWLTYTRNVRADWRKAFGEDIRRIDGVAIMTDADNSGSRAEARYGTIRFCATADCEDESTAESGLRPAGRHPDLHAFQVTRG